MRKIILLFLMLSAVALAGCLPQAQASPTSTVAVVNRPSSTSVVNTPAQAAIFPDSGCTVVTQKPTPGPTPETVYPPVTDTDWTKGPANAKVTIIEYSDFQ